MERAPEEKLVEQEARRAAKPILLEQERADLVESAREIAERVDRESILGMSASIRRSSGP